MATAAASSGEDKGWTFDVFDQGTLREFSVIQLYAY